MADVTHGSNVPRRPPELTLQMARDIGLRAASRVRELCKAAETCLTVGRNKEAMTLALVGLEELAKAQSLALQARIAAETGKSTFLADGFYDHRLKGEVACEIVNGWAGIVLAFHKAAGLEYPKQETAIRTEFARITSSYPAYRESLLYEDVEPKLSEPPDAAINAIIEITDEYADWLRWVFSEEDHTGPLVPIFGLDKLIARRRDLSNELKAKLPELLGVRRRNRGKSAPK